MTFPTIGCLASPDCAKALHSRVLLACLSVLTLVAIGLVLGFVFTVHHGRELVGPPGPPGPPGLSVSGGVTSEGLAAGIVGGAKVSSVTIPDDVNLVQVRMWGGGAAGGYSSAAGSGACSSGGGGGAYVAFTLDVKKGDVCTLTVADGVKVVAGSAAPNGQNSTLKCGSKPLITAQGGTAGQVSQGFGPTFVPGGAGGARLAKSPTGAKDGTFVSFRGQNGAASVCNQDPVVNQTFYWIGGGGHASEGGAGGLDYSCLEFDGDTCLPLDSGTGEQFVRIGGQAPGGGGSGSFLGAPAGSGAPGVISLVFAVQES